MNEKQLLKNSILFGIKDMVFYYLKVFKIAFLILLFFYFTIEKKIFDNQIVYDIISPPKISVFLPIYNKSKYLKRSINSIQKQSLKEIEIIAVNDGSSDNSLDILKEMGKKDSRIKIINSKKSHGSLFCRGLGILNSEGKYLMNLDPDDEYRGKNSFKYLYDTAQKLKLDFISFFILYLPEKKKSKYFSKFNTILRQPELFQSAFENNYLSDFYITNKFIRREILEKAFKSLEYKIYGGKWNYHEDNIWSILVYKYANSSIFINKIFYYYHQNIYSVMSNRGNLLEIKNLLYRNEMYRKIFKDKIGEKYIIAGYLELIIIFEKYIEIIKSNNYIKNECFKELITFKKQYKLSQDIIKRADNLLSKLIKIV